MRIIAVSIKNQNIYLQSTNQASNIHNIYYNGIYTIIYKA